MNIKDIFGKPGEGIHSHRIGPFASVDLFLTVMGAIGLSLLLNKPFAYIFTILFIGGEIIHLVLGVETGFIKMLDTPYTKDIIISFIIGVVIGWGCEFNPILTGILITGISLLFSIFVFKKMTKKITKFIMSS